MHRHLTMHVCESKTTSSCLVSLFFKKSVRRVRRRAVQLYPHTPPKEYEGGGGGGGGGRGILSIKWTLRTGN